MKIIALSLLAAASLSLSACTSQQSAQTAGTVAAVADKLEIESTRALNIAEIGYQAIASAALAAIGTGQIRGNDAVAVRNLNRQATDALIAAKAAVTTATRTAEVTKLIAATAAMQLFATPANGAEQ